MNRDRFLRSRPAVVLGVLLGCPAVMGCFNPFSPRIAPTRGASQPAPAPTTASGVLRLFEWCYNNKAITEYREIFSDDYRFYFSPLDSAGAEWRGTPYTREDELISATNLFVGGSAIEPPASSIRLSFDRNFLVYPDPYFTRYPAPDNTPRDPSGVWHKSIRTTVTLQISTDDGNSLEITGHATFYMVRGDSALIPEEMRNKGFGPDPNRWYIRRWDDDTAEEGALAATLARAAVPTATRWSMPSGTRRSAGTSDLQDTRTASWGEIKAYYRYPPASLAALRTPRP